MKIQKRRNKKGNNAGMSLVEIIIAMFILSTVTVTILSILVYSIRLNSRSRTRQQTTAAAQTVMENFKAYSVQEIAEQFAKIDGKHFDVSVASGAPMQIIRGTALLPDGTLTSEGIAEMLASGDNVSFRVHDMKYQNEYYDVEVQLQNHNLYGRSADMETLIYENRTAENSAAYMGVDTMDSDAMSGIADQVAELWEDAEEADLAAAATPAPTPTADPSGDPDADPEDPDPAPVISHDGTQVDTSQITIDKRVLTVKIRKDAADNCVVEVGCTYYYGGNNYQYDVSETGTPKTFSIPPDSPYQVDLDPTRTELTKEIFNQPIVDGKIPLENLTLYYYPAYSQNTSVKVEHDYIEIIKDGIPDDHEIKCYIYKQRNLRVSDAKISMAELAYDLNLRLDTKVNIYDDNLDTILGSPTSTHSYTTAIEAVDGHAKGERYHGISYAAKNMDYPTAGATPAPAMPTAMPAETVQNIRMMYDITVSVYRQGALPDDGNVPTDAALNVLKSTIIE